MRGIDGPIDRASVMRALHAMAQANPRADEPFACAPAAGTGRIAAH